MRPTDLRKFVGASPIVREPVTSAVEAFASDLPAGAHVLDAGAGSAPYRSLFAHCRYETQDWTHSPHGAGRTADIVADLAALPIASDTYDAVVFTEVLEHVSDPASVLEELGRVVRPGGRLLVTVPFVGELHEEPHDYYRFTSHGLSSLLSDAGFRIEELRPVGGWFSTLAQVLRHQALSTGCPGQSSGVLRRLLAVGSLLVSRTLWTLAPRLDQQFDQRRALPLGWIATAVLPGEQNRMH
jgi:SAM-dependent methyltransferase